MNYLKIAWRNIIKRKFYSVLNVSGLALGITCCIFIYLYTSYHLSFDTYHPKANTTYRLVNEIHFDKTEYDKGASFAMFNALRTKIPQVDGGAIAISNQSFVIDVNGDPKQRFKEEKNIWFTNADWFKLFQYHWLKGGPQQLNEPNTLVITQKLAVKYFGDADPMGKLLFITGKPIKITGVIADDLQNTDLKADLFISTSSFKTLNPGSEDTYFTNWSYLMSINNAFVSLSDVSKKEQIEKQLLIMAAKTDLGPDVGKYFRFKLLPLKQMHFDARYGGPVQKSNLAILSVIGILILVIAGINYINLVIAQQARRTVEIGTRKVLGASSGQLFIQFITESLLTSLIAVIIAVIAVLILLPSVNKLLFTDAPVQVLSYPALLAFAAFMLFCLTVLAGIYPAVVLSRISIYNSLKNKVGNVSAGVGRKVLVVLQNVVTQGLIVCTIVIALQVHYLKNTDTGFNRESVITIPVGQLSDSKKIQLANSFKLIPGVKSFTFCHRAPSSDSQVGATVQFNNNVKWETWPARFAIGDSAYCRTFGIHIIAGRNIVSGRTIPEFLVNETLVRYMHLKSVDDVIGKNFTAGDFKGIITGVVKDFNVRTLAEPIEPSVVLEDHNFQTNVAIKLSGLNTGETLRALQKNYLALLPDQVFTYRFVDEQIAALYKSETLQQKLIWTSAGIAIFISCLGLIGLVSIIILQRTKEIGIRKVLGASVPQIVSLLSGHFIKLILLAFVIAAPIAWLAMNQWLHNFAHHIQIHWWVFASAGLMAIIIALLSVGLQSVKIALANPVNSLRDE